MFGVQQQPDSSARRARTRPCIVASETSIQIVRPANISSRPGFSGTTYNVDEAFHCQGVTKTSYKYRNDEWNPLGRSRRESLPLLRSRRACDLAHFGAGYQLFQSHFLKSEKPRL
jgi:hypothetical protein